MHVITIALKGGAMLQYHYIGGLNAQPVYEEIERQRKAWAPCGPSIITGTSIISLKDDYGHTGIVDVCEIGGVVLADVEKEFKAKAEIQFLNTQANGELQKRLASTPGARLLTPGPGGMQ